MPEEEPVSVRQAWRKTGFRGASLRKNRFPWGKLEEKPVSVGQAWGRTGFREPNQKGQKVKQTNKGQMYRKGIVGNPKSHPARGGASARGPLLRSVLVRHQTITTAGLISLGFLPCGSLPHGFQSYLSSLHNPKQTHTQTVQLTCYRKKNELPGESCRSWPSGPSVGKPMWIKTHRRLINDSKMTLKDSKGLRNDSKTQKKTHKD